jgi:hypothetical protein
MDWEEWDKTNFVHECHDCLYKTLTRQKSPPELVRDDRKVGGDKVNIYMPVLSHISAVNNWSLKLEKNTP